MLLRSVSECSVLLIAVDMSLENYCFENSVYRKKIFSPLKKMGYVPEKGSELFVSGIPRRATIYDLLQFFEGVGELFQIKLMTKPDGIHNRGFAYITYMNKYLSQKAMRELKDRPFSRGGPLLQLQQSVDNCRIFVGGIPINKTKDEIWQELKTGYKIKNIVDVITYRNYSNPIHNRGYVFLEFRTHEEASYFRAKYWDKLQMFGKKLMVAWSIPTIENEQELEKVKILFLRNIEVTQTSEDFSHIVHQLMDRSLIEKVYKFKDYAYIHLATRADAEVLMERLKRYYHETMVEVSFAKPPNKFTERAFRDQALISRRSKMRHNSATSTEYALSEASSSPSLPSPTGFDLRMQLNCVENKLLQLEAEKMLLQNTLASTSGPSSFIRDTPYTLSRAERPDLLPAAGPSFWQPLQVHGVRPITNIKHGYPMGMGGPMNPTYHQDFDDLEDMVNNLLDE